MQGCFWTCSQGPSHKKPNIPDSPQWTFHSLILPPRSPVARIRSRRALNRIQMWFISDVLLPNAMHHTTSMQSMRKHFLFLSTCLITLFESQVQLLSTFIPLSIFSVSLSITSISLSITSISLRSVSVSSSFLTKSLLGDSLGRLSLIYGSSEETSERLS